jgi:hypothetical protein
VNQLETLKLIDKFRAEAKAAIVAERERCAKICETSAIYYAGGSPMGLVPNKLGDPVGHLFAAAIRNVE